MDRLIFFVGVYDTLDLFTEVLQIEFQAMGYETMTFDVRVMEESLRKLGNFIERPVQAAITFNNLGFNMELVPGKNIWEELKIPCINILMDHPFCYLKAMDEAPSNAVVLCTDRNHMRYIQRFHKNIPVSGFLPHAGISFHDSYKRIEERTIDVIYAGNLSAYIADPIRPDYSKYQSFDAKKIGEKALELMIQDPDHTTDQAVEKVLQQEGIQLSEETLKELIADMRYIDCQAVSYYRERTVQVLVEAGIKVHVFGAGWDCCKWVDDPNLIYGGKIPAKDVVELMQDSKIVLSTMTWFKDGTHDRVFNGMMAGAVAVTDTSGYMLENFTDEKELIFFKLEELDKLPEKVNWLLEHQKEAQQIADRGHQCASREHTWKNRAVEIRDDILANEELMEFLHR